MYVVNGGTFHRLKVSVHVLILNEARRSVTVRFHRYLFIPRTNLFLDD